MIFSPDVIRVDGTLFLSFYLFYTPIPFQPLPHLRPITYEPALTPASASVPILVISFSSSK